MIDNVFIGGKGLCYYVYMNYFIVGNFGKGEMLWIKKSLVEI